jgi:hypothetical protein
MVREIHTGIEREQMEREGDGENETVKRERKKAVSERKRKI